MADDYRARIEAAWRAFHESYAGLPDDALIEPGAAGEWSVKDLLAHIAFCHEDMLAIAMARLAGEDPPPPDVEAQNRESSAARAGWSLQHARDEADRTYRLALEAAAGIPDIDPELLAGDTWNHYAAHADDIRAWRARTGR